MSETVRTYRPWKLRLFGNLWLRVGVPVHRPFMGIERAPFRNGAIFRVSLWPNVTGFYVVYWREP